MPMLFGVGVGPGDPELMTLKAVRVLQSVDVVAYFAKAGNRSHALAVADGVIPASARRIALEYPVTTEIDRNTDEYKRLIDDFYNQSSECLAESLDAGYSVAVIAEGDPLFFGSYMHLHVRLSTRFKTEVISGVSGMSASWSTTQLPICQGDDVFSVLPGTLDESVLIEHMRRNDALVIMKVGRNLAKIRRALAGSGRLSRAVYVERAAQPGNRIMALHDKPDDNAPYFSLVLVPGWNALGFDSPILTRSAVMDDSGASNV